MNIREFIKQTVPVERRKLETYKEQNSKLEQIERTLTELDDEVAAKIPSFYPEWKLTSYSTGDRVLYNDVLYKCLQSHEAQETWTPEDAPSLWAKVINEGIPEWEQPSSTNPYMKGDKVKHNGETWESLIDNNVWEPSDSVPTLWRKV